VNDTLLEKLRFFNQVYYANKVDRTTLLAAAAVITAAECEKFLNDNPHFSALGDLRALQAVFSKDYEECYKDYAASFENNTQQICAAVHDSISEHINTHRASQTEQIEVYFSCIMILCVVQFILKEHDGLVKNLFNILKLEKEGVNVENVSLLWTMLACLLGAESFLREHIGKFHPSGK
jgi:hypothetical protein